MKYICIRSSYLESMPKSLYPEVGSFLPVEDVQSLAAVSTVFRSTMNNVTLWTKIARKLNMRVVEGRCPKVSVFTYHIKVIRQICELLIWNAPRAEGYPPVPKSEDIFTQYRFFKNYVIENQSKDWLSLAAQETQKEGVHFLLNNGLVPHNSDPLLNAIESGNAEIVDLLLQAQSPISEECIVNVIKRGSADMVRLLIAAGVQFDESALTTAILRNAWENAINNGEAERVASLMEAGAIDEESIENAAAKQGRKIIQVLFPRVRMTAQSLCAAIHGLDVEMVSAILKAANGRFAVTQDMIDFVEGKGHEPLASLLRTTLASQEADFPL